jgi:hypothetical protein
MNSLQRPHVQRAIRIPSDCDDLCYLIPGSRHHRADRGILSAKSGAVRGREKGASLDSNMSNQRQASAVGSAHKRSHVMQQLGDMSGLKSGSSTSRGAHYPEDILNGSARVGGMKYLYKRGMLLP